MNLLVCLLVLAAGGPKLGATPFLASVQAVSNAPPGSQTATLGWDPSPDPAASGYFLCWGCAADQCTNRFDVGNVTNASVAGLSLGQVYWFEVVAYDAAGDEALPSNEISYQPSQAAQATALSLGVTQQGGGKVAQLSFQGQAGLVYELQATTDFHSWVNVLTTNSTAAGLFTIQSQDMSLYPRRFYRLLVLPPGS